MKHFVPLILLLTFGCTETLNTDSVQNNNLFVLGKIPKIGDPIPIHDSIGLSSNYELLVTSSQTWPASAFMYEGCTFEIAWSSYGGVKYISTSCHDFVTPEKIQAGMKLKEIDVSKFDKIRTMPGWGHYVELKSGWKAAFCIDSTCTGRPLNGNDKVDWLFKR